MLAAALEEEVSGFLGRDRYERGEEFRGYRNGYHRSRELTVGSLSLWRLRRRGCRTCLLRWLVVASSRR